MNTAPVLERASTIAVVGCSPSEARTSHRIARYLQKVGYRVIPVNPHADEILGEVCYPAVSAIPPQVQVDIVNVFRRARFTADTVEDTMKRAELTGQRPAIWTQLGVSSPQAERLAERAGLDYVRGRCIMVEHQRIFG